jgi:hypothetical protein
MRLVIVMILLALTILAVIGARTAANAQNAKDVTDTPARLTSSARIAPEGEPGTPLVVSGIVVGEDGKTPLAGIVVYAYHTDDSGHYRNENGSRRGFVPSQRVGQDRQSWSLRIRYDQAGICWSAVSTVRSTGVVVSAAKGPQVVHPNLPLSIILSTLVFSLIPRGSQCDRPIEVTGS